MTQYISSFRKDFHQSARDAFQRPYLHGSLDRRSRLGHAVDRRTLLVLGDGEETTLAHLFQTLGAVAAHAGEQDAHGIARPETRHTLEEHVDRGAVDFTDRLGRIAKLAALQQALGSAPGLGYTVSVGDVGSVQAVLIDQQTGKQYGGADDRREGTVIGLPRPQGK